VALHRDNHVLYLAVGHMGTISVVLDAAGTKVDESRHYPNGTERWPLDGPLPTEYRFTGQLLDASLGLYHMGARWYDPLLARWLSADTVVPNPGDPQTLDRFSYVGGRPPNHVDPSGHVEQDEADAAMNIIELLRDLYGIFIDLDFGWQPVSHPGPGEPSLARNKGAWQLGDLEHVSRAVEMFARAAGGAAEAREALSGVAIRRGSASYKSYWWTVLDDSTFTQPGLRAELGPEIAVVHELAHYWDWKSGNLWSKLFDLQGRNARGMAAFTGDESGPTAYGRTNTSEEWAESVAMYVYPAYRDLLVAEGNKQEVDPKNGIFPALRMWHQVYVRLCFVFLAEGGCP
jgi:RHS repeat-associated protein